MLRGHGANLVTLGSRAQAAATSAGAAITTAVTSDSGYPTNLGNRARTLWTSWRKPAPKPNLDAVVTTILPGWAVSGAATSRNSDSPSPVIIISLHGLCTVRRDASTASRTQRTVISLARRFAALPDVDDLALPGDEMRGVTTGPSASPSATWKISDPSVLSAAYSELDRRLNPFWNSTVPDQTVLVRVYLLDHTRQRIPRPIHIHRSVTDDDGHFRERIIIPAESIYATIASRTTPAPETEAFPTDSDLSSLQVVVDCEPIEMSSPNAALQSQSVVSEDKGTAQSARPAAVSLGPLHRVASQILHVSKPGGVRVLSDIDDTIKHSGILSGPREVFRNVFCRPVQELVIQGMNSLFRDLSKAGAGGFHYVSNSPIQLLASMTEFLHMHDFPPDFSLALKSYSGMSLISSLLDSPAARKHDIILELLDSFPHCRFLMFGDSAEQDLELYTSINASRPGQIQAIFIRDVTSGRTGFFASQASDGPEGVSSPITPVQTSDTVSSSRTSSRSSSIDSSDGVEAITSAQRKILDRALNWERRVRFARESIGSTPLLLFSDPQEIRSVALGYIKDARENV